MQATTHRPLPSVIATSSDLPGPARSFQAADLVLWGLGYTGDRLDAASAAIRRDNSAMKTPLIADAHRELVERRIPTREERDEIRCRFPIIPPKTRDVPDCERVVDDAAY